VNYGKQEETKSEPVKQEEKPEQLNLFEEKLLTKEAIIEHKIIGQLFDTYWLVEFNEQLYIIDQHAAHERVLYEKTLNGIAVGYALPSIAAFVAVAATGAKEISEALSSYFTSDFVQATIAPTARIEKKNFFI
jgi:DNA mismatch repair ATPase MutL